MSSTPSSSSSSATPAHLIDDILNTKADKPDFDLARFVAQIDVLLAHYDAQLRKKKPTLEKLGELPSTTEASNFADQVSTNVKLIVSEIKEYSGNTHETSIAVLNAIGNVHWVAVGFLMVGAALKIADIIENNKEECLRLFKSMIDLSKVILQLQELPSLQKELHTKLNESIQLIVKGAITCCSQKKRKGIKSVFRASKDKSKLQQLSKNMDEMRETLHLQICTSTLKISTSTLKGVQSIGNTLTSLICPQPPHVPALNHDAVGIEEKIKEVIQELDWESDSATTGVVLYGIGGSGKTTLTDAVYSSLKDKLEGWKHCKVTLIQNLEKDPKIENIQSLILQDLTGTKHDVRDCQSGQRSLQEIIEKEYIFLYIDNALYLEPLEKLLPKDFTSAKKFRLLVTARETNAKGVIEYCRIEPCKLYDIGSLSIDGALEVLCRKIERKTEKESILQERPQVRIIAEQCRCCPLFLEVIGAYIHQRENSVESYKRVLCWLNSGDDFSGSENYKFDESRVLFSYEGLNPSAKEAFLDMCSFFPEGDWEWEEVTDIVGEEEMKCLQEGALIKREGKKIKIHDLILAAGRNKSKHDRIRSVEEFSSTFKNKELVSQVEGVCLKGLERPLHIPAEELDEMSRSLRIFYLGYEASKLTIMKGKCGKQFDKLRFLHVGRGVSNLPINIFNLTHLRYLSIDGSKMDVILSPSMNLPNLKVLKLSGDRIHGIAEIAHLRSLKQLELFGCKADGISECFPNLSNLQRLKLKLTWCLDLTELHGSFVRLRCLQKLDLKSCMLKQLPAGFGELTSLTELNLSDCSSLKQLPAGFGKLTSLTELNLSDCSSLKQLPAGFGELTSLTELNLSNCRSLQELPRDLEKLTKLQSLNIRGCSSLLCLPHSVAGLMSALGSNIDLFYCSSLTQLPEEICKNTMVSTVSLYNCTRLKMLPSRFAELTCLQRLDLSECVGLQELCNDFHCLRGLKELSLSYCKSLSSLPQGFGKLSSLETLNLSGCAKLEELCSDFKCLVALKYLDLSYCDSLCNLPDNFGELVWLESLNLSRCSKLVKLSNDFHLCPSLRILDLSECESLGGECMDKVGNIRSLWRVDIVGNKRMIERWMETKNQKERNPVVVTDFLQGKRALLVEGVVSKVFDEEGLLVDADERPFHSSSLQHHSPLILIIDSYYGHQEWGASARRLQQLQCNSKELQIIYVGRNFKSLPPELASRILAHTAENSQILSFLEKLFSWFDHTLRGLYWYFTREPAVFRRSDQLEENNLKCLSAWEDISYISDGVDFLTNTPRENNIELLKELLVVVTQETDYLLHNGNSQVKIAALQGKVILLLLTSLDAKPMYISAVKEMYLKMQESGFTNKLVEVVWIPLIRWEDTWEEFERAAAHAPWPLVPNPWLIQSRIKSFIRMQGKDTCEEQGKPCMCVVDEKGRISNRDPIAMIERWGEEAYPFSQAREDELRKAEWEGFKFNSSSTLQFVFQNVSNKAKEMVDRGIMKLICVGSHEKMMELAPHLNSGLTMLEMEFQVFYVADMWISTAVADMWESTANGYVMACEKLEENESEKCSIATLSSSDIYKLWQRVGHLQNELKGMGTDERIVKVRRMVLGILRADRESKRYDRRMSIVLVDGNGEMVSGKGMEFIQLLCDGEEDSKKRLVEDIKSEGVEKSVESRWRDGIIHPKHYPQHPLLELVPLGWRDGISCSLCSDKCWLCLYQCNVCENYAICEECAGVCEEE